MNPDIPALLPVFRELTGDRGPLVLATIVETEGSTYRKPGARMLIDAGGNWHGILGGGCFEGDLAERAANTIAEGTGQLVEYDMRGEGDLLWGLGLGCDGLVRILLQPLAPELDYQPFGWLSRLVERKRRGVLATLLRPAGGLPAGASLGVDDETVTPLGMDDALAPEIAAAAKKHLGEARSTRVQTGPPDAPLDLLLTPCGPAPHLLIVGAGPDAQPVARIARDLYWDVTVLDHREALARLERFAPGCEVRFLDPENLAGPDLASVSAALLMTHNFAADIRWLKALASNPPAYIGLLGPARRKQRLLDALEDGERDAVAHRAVGPVGFDIGGEMPGSIALAALAEIHAFLAGRSGASLGTASRDG